jgi:hypothetical protein
MSDKSKSKPLQEGVIKGNIKFSTQTTQAPPPPPPPQLPVIKGKN